MKKKNGELINIYLKKETDSKNFQITYAKSGFFLSKNNEQILVLKNGQTINKIENDLTTFNFKESSLNMSNQDSGIIKVDKIQETSTLNLVLCINRFEKFFLNNSTQLKKKFIQNCTEENLDNVFKEVYKRLLVPLYIPSLILCALILVIYSKENINYTRFRVFVFVIGFVLIVFSETTQKLIKKNLEYNIIIFLIPLLVFFLILISINKKIDFKIVKN